MYNASLSADATPALVKLPNGFVDDVLDEQRFRLAEGDGLSGFNVSRERARSALGF